MRPGRPALGRPVHAGIAHALSCRVVLILTPRLLAVLTYRPEFIPPWGSYSYLSQLTLSRLGQSQVEVMVENATGGKALPQEIVRQIASKTDGVPLFVEELTKMVVESSLVTEVNGHYELTGPLPPLAIPSTLQDSAHGAARSVSHRTRDRPDRRHNRAESLTTSYSKRSRRSARTRCSKDCDS